LLVIDGSRAVVSPSLAAEIVKLNHCLEVVQIEDAGHGIPFDQPERFSTIVKTFLHSLSA
jgi:N-formylmaleamate deformylase